MAFFSKLKERLFKSSSKLDEGLDAIVDDGGTPEAQTPDPATPLQPEETPPHHPQAAPLDRPEERPERAPKIGRAHV